MATYCTTCFEEHDEFDTCKGFANSANTSQNPTFANSRSTRLPTSPIVYGPLVAIGLDLLLPTPTYLWTNLLLVLIAGTLVNVFWYRSRTHSRVTTKSVLAIGFTPKLIKLFELPQNQKKQTVLWLVSFLASVLLTQSIGTPGNSAAIEKVVSKKIDEATGLSLVVKCPPFFASYPGQVVRCTVDTGVLGVEVPLDLTFEGVNGEVSWQAKLW